MDSRDRRGQLILVAAFGLAVAFVVLALVLNSVVFTENLATRNHDRTDEALAFEGAVEQGVGGLVSEANDNESATFESLRAELEETVPRWSENVTYLSASQGTLRSALLVDAENGTQIIQSNETTFTNGTGDGDWTLAPGVNETRRFHVLAGSDSNTGVDISVVNGSASWSVAVSENDSDASKTDVVVRRNGSVVSRTESDADPVEVDVTEGLVEGERIDNWTFGAGVSAPYDISVSDGDQATGKYVMFVDRSEDAVHDAQPSGTYTDSGDPGPTTVAAIYRAFVDISVRTDVLTYESTVSVAPEEPPGNETYDVDG